MNLKVLHIVLLLVRNNYRVGECVSLSKTSDGDNKYYATELSILIDGTYVNVAEYGVLDNDGDMGTISVSRNGSNLELKVTPNPSIRPITVRYARMGLKA